MATKLMLYDSLVCPKCGENCTVESFRNPRFCPFCGAEYSLLFNLTPQDNRDPLQAIWEYYKHSLSKPFATFSDKRRNMVRRCFDHAVVLAKGDLYKAQEYMEIAVDELAASDFHNARKQYKGQKKYNDIEYAFRSIEQFEKWLNRSNGE